MMTPANDGILEAAPVDSSNVSTKESPPPASDTNDHGSEPFTDEAIADSDHASQRPAYLSLIFRDGLDMPIDGLTFIATFPSGEMCMADTTEDGAVAVPIPPTTQGAVKIDVKDATGGKQSVCTLDLNKCGDATVIVRSPKTKATVSLQPHQQTVPPRAKPQTPPQAEPKKEKAAPQHHDEPVKVDTHASWWSINGAWNNAWAWITSEHHFFGEAHAAGAPRKHGVATGLSDAGQPLAAVLGPEAPNKDNLRLGRNNIYREPILEASKRLGLIPQALCALMDCEAGKIVEKLPLMNADGTPAKDKKGQPILKQVRERWNANAGNAQSGAAGLTQFLASTWLTHVLIPRCYIHDQSVANGWIKQVADAKGNKRWMFVLADGSTTTTPYDKRQTDANVKKCLAMRMDPAWSINAAADYGNANLKVLEKAGFKLSGLNDMDRAKLMYLMHHEGEGAGPLFIRNTLATGKGGTGALTKKFELQLGSSGKQKAEKLIRQADGDVAVAYRYWFANFVDGQFSQTSKYFSTNPISAKSLSALLVATGGKEIELVE